MRWFSRLSLGLTAAVLSLSGSPSSAAFSKDAPLLQRHVQRVLSTQASDQAACDAAFQKNPFATYLTALPATGGLRNCIASNINDLMVPLSAPGATCTLTSLVSLLSSGSESSASGMAALTSFFNTLLSGLATDATTTATTPADSVSSILSGWSKDSTTNEAFCGVMNAFVGPCIESLVPVIVAILDKKAACCDQLVEFYELGKLIIPDGKTLDQLLVEMINGLHRAMCTTTNGDHKYCGQSLLAMLAASIEETGATSLMSPLLIGGSLPLFALPDGSAACAAVDGSSFASRVSSSGGPIAYAGLSCCATGYASLIQSVDGILKHLTGSTLAETLNLITGLQDAPPTKQFVAPYTALADCTFKTTCANPSFLLTAKSGAPAVSSSTNSTKNLSAQDVQCTTTELCDADKVCSQVCKEGSVKVAPWVARAVTYQRKLSYAKPLCFSQLVGTHNSGTTLARGWGNRDQLMNKVLDPTDATSYMRTANQVLTLTDQMNLGARFVELDVHFFGGKIHDGHCSHISSSILDDVSKAIKTSAEILLSAGETTPVLVAWQSSLMGCVPSLGGIRAGDVRVHADSVTEIATWLKANPTEFLFVYLDVGSEVSTFNKYDDAIGLHTAAYGDLLLTPGDLKKAGASWSTTPLNDLVKQGKRVALLTSKAANGDAYFALDLLCGGWVDIPSGKTGGAPGTIWGAKTNAGTLVRAYSSHLHYATMSEETLGGEAVAGTETEPSAVSAATLPVFSNAGVNILAPDDFDGSVLQAMVWTWAPDEPSRGDTVVQISASDGRWYGVSDKASIQHIACVSSTSRVMWKVVPQGSSCPDGYAFDAPTLAIENAALWTSLKATGPDATAQLNVDIASLPVVTVEDEAAYRGATSSGTVSNGDGTTGKNNSTSPQPSSVGVQVVPKTSGSVVILAMVSMVLALAHVL